MKNPSVLSDTGPRVSSSAFFSLPSLPLPPPPQPRAWQLSIITPLLLLLHFRCFSSLSPVLPASPCRLLGGLLRNILSSPLRASVR
uniref:Uncharacterized protein n=3 Tax=Haplochromini TaxID=319058 RepID=A0A3Q2VEZ4_HAPBU